MPEGFGDDISYITQAGVVFIAFFFTMAVAFYILSPVVESFFGTYNALQVGDATDEVQFFGPLLHTACKIILALGVAIPVAWFVFWCMSRQTSHYKGR